MSEHDEIDEEKLGELLAMLPPPPEAWIATASALPATLRALAEIEARVLGDAEARAAVTADLERALREAGVEQLDARAVAALRRRLEQ